MSRSIHNTIANALDVGHYRTIDTVRQIIISLAADGYTIVDAPDSSIERSARSKTWSPYTREELIGMNARLHERLAELRGTIARQASDLGEHNRQITELENKNRTQTNTIRGQDEQLEDLRDKLNLANDEIVCYRRARYKALEAGKPSQIDALHREIEGLEQEVAGYSKMNAAQLKQIAKLKAIIKKNNDRRRSLGDRVTDLEKQMKHCQARW